MTSTSKSYVKESPVAREDASYVIEYMTPLSNKQSGISKLEVDKSRILSSSLVYSSSGEFNVH